jgi:hypothetical protein
MIYFPKLNTYRNVIYDIQDGIYSDIPLCCILWYITIWPLFLLFNWNMLYVRHSLYFNFIPCPICLIRYRNVGKSCNAKPIEEREE